jgi:hypothetical protein
VVLVVSYPPPLGWAAPVVSYPPPLGCAAPVVSADGVLTLVVSCDGIVLVVSYVGVVGAVVSRDGVAVIVVSPRSGAAPVSSFGRLWQAAKVAAAARIQRVFMRRS